MTYLAVNQGTADWLLGKTGLLDAIHAALVADTQATNALSVCEVVEGPLRIAASQDRNVIAVWNVDYLSGTGDESWGFIHLGDKCGLRGELTISREVLERELYVINQRLQGLLLDGAYIHRTQSNGVHTCLAGRGTAARQYSIGYIERTVDSAESLHHAVLCVGPAFDFNELSRSAADAGRQLQWQVASANSLVAIHRKRAVADDDVLPDVRAALRVYTHSEAANEYGEVEVVTQTAQIRPGNQFRSLGLTYHQWVVKDSPLSEVQRRILQGDAIDSHPLRIVGPGGSGKTLLMQLLALRRLDLAKQRGVPVRILYITHNGAMAEQVARRFDVLEGLQAPLRDTERTLDIYTLSEYGRTQLGLEYTAVIDPDAFEAKQFQLEQVTIALVNTMAEQPDLVSASRLFSEVKANKALLGVLARLVMAEISTAIKGHGLEGDKRRYVQSERSLSRLHGLLSTDERQLVFRAFEHYNRAVFEGMEVLDTDDIALSLLGRLRTPIWELKRRALGYDYVFVDETQLFNENERRVLPLLTNGHTSHVPIVLALDEAQDVFGQSQSTAGLATLGIPGITNESLASIHRSTRSIVRLAFFVIQRSTDLFGPDFPDFTGIADQMEDDSHPFAAPPRIEVAGEDTKKLGKFVVRRIREFRKANLWRIAVICHSDVYWENVQEELTTAGLPLHILLERGERLPTDTPVVVLTRPLLAGGQEFDAVLLVGLEQGLVPPRVLGNDALAAAVEQQALRELYLAITRARYRVSVVVSSGASPSSVIRDAEKAGLIVRA